MTPASRGSQKCCSTAGGCTTRPFERHELEVLDVPPGAVRAQLEKHDRHELFPSGTVPLTQVQKPDHHNGLVKLEDREVAAGAPRTCVRVVLEEPLSLNLRGTKRAQLMPARCTIPELDRGAKSLNEAYSVVSQEYERWRRSHSGNVFKKVLFLDSGKGRPDLWRELDLLRARKEAAQERLLFGASPQKPDPDGVCFDIEVITERCGRSSVNDTSG